jgi:hypothetical protein
MDGRLMTLANDLAEAMYEKGIRSISPEFVRFAEIEPMDQAAMHACALVAISVIQTYLDNKGLSVVLPSDTVFVPTLRIEVP